MIVEGVREELQQHVDLEYRDRFKGFFKEGIELWGVRASQVRKIAGKYFKRLKGRSKQEILDLCKTLLQSGYSEEQSIAFDWAFRLRKQYESSDFSLFESWLENHVNNWGACDDLCTHAFGYFIHQFPDFLAEIKGWAESDNRWFRRASAVVLIYSIRRDKYIETALEIADLLLSDEDDLVQKGYGWMLKEVSNLHPEQVFQYVMNHKEEMPRTSLRYAIEKLPPDLRKQAMAKD